MLSKAKIKFIKSLQVKKYRKQEQCFVVQGAKSVQELLTSGFEVTMILGTTDFLRQLSPNVKAEIIEVSEKELSDLSEFQTNDSALAVARMKVKEGILVTADEFALVLDDIRDPGNLGTIIRTADWFGINKIIASEETADFYNPKVISATMGSFARIEIYYTNLAEYLVNTTLPVYGAFLHGKDVHDTDFGSGGLIVIGNESRGISESLEKFITDKITIPRYGKAESLNAAIATAVICDNVVRRKFKV
ncbi:MAG TPA: RNA methyltransferase [Ohtaekwangia sp.]|uniref:TrmH family RNA methyltransferase n=1 Tax=Ohtaekwangia sp. TaxID=2066019 RepID=UPI002F94811A